MEHRGEVKRSTMFSESSYDAYQNINIHGAVALDKTNISSCLLFSMQILEVSYDLDRASRRSNFNASQ